MEKPQSFTSFYEQKNYYPTGGEKVYWSFECNTCTFLQDLQRFRLDNPQSHYVIERQLATDMELFANSFSEKVVCVLRKYRTVIKAAAGEELLAGAKEHKNMIYKPLPDDALLDRQCLADRPIIVKGIITAIVVTSLWLLSHRIRAVKST